MITFNIEGMGFKGFRVRAVKGVLAGVYHERETFQPDCAAIRAELPHRWRKAFDRAGGFWWPKSACLPTLGIDTVDNERPQGLMVLQDWRGRYLTTLHADAAIVVY